MKHKMKGVFGQWDTKAEEYASSRAHPESGVLHCVDVYETQDEWESVLNKDEACGWTYVADDDGVEELKKEFFSAEIFDSFGLSPEEWEAIRVQG
jgi:hypothetical protein